MRFTPTDRWVQCCFNLGGRANHTVCQYTGVLLIVIADGVMNTMVPVLVEIIVLAPFVKWLSSLENDVAHILVVVI